MNEWMNLLPLQQMLDAIMRVDGKFIFQQECIGVYCIQHSPTATVENSQLFSEL